MAYQRMYETRNVRPYYSIIHLGVFGTALKKLTGFEYTKTLYSTSKEMNNAAFFESSELALATAHFKRVWQDDNKTKFLIQTIRQGFSEALKIEEWAWKQVWKDKATDELVSDLQLLYRLLWQEFGTMIISQPQHVSSLEEQLNALLSQEECKDEKIKAATNFMGDYPWAKEDEKIKFLHAQWPSLSKHEQSAALDGLVKKYGWFNEVEGNKAFDARHYEEKIISFKTEEKRSFENVTLSPELTKIGQLIGELGYLRFCNRYHFMHIRYHLNKVREELIYGRMKEDRLEFATIEELLLRSRGESLNFDSITERKNGYITCLENGKAVIYCGEAAEKYKKLVYEEASDVAELRGSIANKGYAQGRVRVISFSADNYNEEVEAFKQGEILVTGMTRPQIVHLCRKAAAIVTDEGGITSHAAVISRELNVPCVIATHRATDILKTGDMVEVDANKGIIKKLL